MIQNQPPNPSEAFFSFESFMQTLNLSKQDIYQSSFDEKQQVRRIRKKKTIIKNLDKIFGSVLKISNKKGFKAMSMRDLSLESGLSMGALYNYFSGKDDLLEMLQHQQRSITGKLLEERIAAVSSPRDKLKAAIYTHLYLSEALQPWFYFSFMEAKNLTGAEKEKTVASERATEKLFFDILTDGQAQEAFHPHEPRLGASLIKAMLQDWYLKRGKYANRAISVDQYADYVYRFVETFYVKAEDSRLKGEG